MMRRILLLIVAASVLAGCETMSALGRDIQKLGSNIERKAKE
jgi:predicted small secreted protein